MPATVNAQRFRSVLGITDGELHALIATYVLGSREGLPTTVGVVHALVEAVHGVTPAGTNKHINRILRLGLVEHLGRCAGSILIRPTPRGVQKLREWSGAFERAPEAAE